MISTEIDFYLSDLDDPAFVDRLSKALSRHGVTVESRGTYCFVFTRGMTSTEFVVRGYYAKVEALAEALSPLGVSVVPNHTLWAFS